MKLLYSNVLPMRLKPGQTTFLDYFMQAAKQADEIEIAVGYASKESLRELQRLVNEYSYKRFQLIIGMYFIEGMPESIFHEAEILNELLTDKGVGEVKLVRPFKYHGKAYVFFKNGKQIAGIIGSNNLGAVKPEASNLRQYELASATENVDEIQPIHDFIQELGLPKCSVNLANATGLKIIREMNTALVDQKFVDRVTSEEVEAYKKCLTDITFEIPLKVPDDVHDSKMRGSNINVCYASGRKRVWWECEIVVGKSVRDVPGYPEFQRPFIAVTDDGWRFQVWTCGQGNKNLYSKDDLKIMGRWLKGRLAAAGLVKPVNQVETDTAGEGLITKKTLKKYGRDTITLTKTTQRRKTEEGEELDVWMLSFLPES